MSPEWARTRAAERPEPAMARQGADRPVAAAACPLPSPEEVFADWLRSVPRDADLGAAAKEQMALIDRRASHHPDVQFLRKLLAAVAGECTWRKPFANL
jgi:hypothetical protein